MTATEILTLLGGLGLGYLVVSLLMGGNKKPAAKFPGDKGWAPATPPSPPTWPQVLGVLREASMEEIRSAHARLSAQYTQQNMADLGPEFQALAQSKLQAIDEALRQAQAEKETP